MRPKHHKFAKCGEDDQNHRESDGIPGGSAVISRHDVPLVALDGDDLNPDPAILPIFRYEMLHIDAISALALILALSAWVALLLERRRQRRELAELRQMLHRAPTVSAPLERREPVMSAPNRAGADNDERVLAEVEVLRGLVEQLSTGRGNRAVQQRPGRAALAGSEPTAPPISPLGLEDDEVMLDVMREALRADRVDLYLQAVVSLPQRKLRFYDCSIVLRAPDGRTITPERYRPLAEAAGLMGTVDNVLLIRSVQLVRRMRRQPQPLGFFCRIARDTLEDRDFFADFVTFMRENTDLAGSLVFAIAQHDADRLEPRTEQALEQLAKLGFRFCLDEAERFELFVSDLSNKGFRFVRATAPSLLGRASSGDPRALKRSLDPGAIDLIVDQIDGEATLLDLLDFAVDFGQGRLFGEPRPSE